MKASSQGRLSRFYLAPMKYPKYQLRVSDDLLQALHEAGADKVRALLEAHFVLQKVVLQPESFVVQSPQNPLVVQNLVLQLEQKDVLVVQDSEFVVQPEKLRWEVERDQKIEAEEKAREARNRLAKAALAAALAKTPGNGSK